MKFVVGKRLKDWKKICSNKYAKYSKEHDVYLLYIGRKYRKRHNTCYVNHTGYSSKNIFLKLSPEFAYVQALRRDKRFGKLFMDVLRIKLINPREVWIVCDCSGEIALRYQKLVQGIVEAMLRNLTKNDYTLHNFIVLPLAPYNSTFPGDTILHYGEYTVKWSWVRIWRYLDVGVMLKELNFYYDNGKKSDYIEVYAYVLRFGDWYTFITTGIDEDVYKLIDEITVEAVISS